MHNMKNKIMAISLCCIVIFTGCTKDTSYPLAYHNNKSDTNITTSDIDQRSSLFASDICVIPDDYNDEDTEIDASSAIIINSTDSKVLFASNPHERLYPASITKIMTAYLVLANCNLDDNVTISHDAANLTESGIKKCGYNEGDVVSVKDLLYSMLIYSGNDAATALGCYISKTENNFAKLMNEQVKKMGATNTHFCNANGLHNDNHYTTSYDLYLILNECVKYDEFRKIVATKSYTVNYKDSNGSEKSKTFESTNQYITGETSSPTGVTVIGGKTGTTNKAGHCLILYSEDADGKFYVSVVLNANTSDALYRQMNHLLSFI